MNIGEYVSFQISVPDFFWIYSQVGITGSYSSHCLFIFSCEFHGLLTFSPCQSKTFMGLTQLPPLLLVHSQYDFCPPITWLTNRSYLWLLPSLSIHLH